MASSQLSEVLKGGSKNKVAIGYSVRGYENILTTVGSIYGNNTGSLSRKVVYVDNNPNQPQEPQSSGLGSVSITEEMAVNGFYSQYELAAVEIHPITAFPYNDDGNNYSVVTFNQTVGQDGAIYDGTKKSVPEVFDKASIDACAQDNTGDFIVGAGLGIGGEFGQKYVDNFYNGQLTKDDLCKLCKDGVLYAEIFFPSQTTADIMIARVIYDTDGTTKVSGDLTFWNCYIPAPILALDGYNSYFELMAGNTTIQQPSYGSNAIYSYVNATIQGFGPASVKTQIETTNPTSMTATITKWPGMAEDAQGYAVAYARVRLVVPPDMASQAETSIGKKLPERLTTLSDASIATGIAQSMVVGGDSSTMVTSGSGLNLDTIMFGMELMNMFEAGAKGQDQLEDVKDGEGWTFGWFSMTCKSGNIADLGVELSKLGNTADGAILKTSKKNILSQEVKSVLKRLMWDETLIKASIELYRKKFWNETISRIKQLNVQTALGIALVIRQTIHFPGAGLSTMYYAQKHGSVRKFTYEEAGGNLEPQKNGGTIEAEKAWIKKFWETYGECSKWGGWKNEAKAWLDAVARDDLNGKAFDCGKNWGNKIIRVGHGTNQFFEKYKHLFKALT